MPDLDAAGLREIEVLCIACENAEWKLEEEKAGHRLAERATEIRMALAALRDLAGAVLAYQDDMEHKTISQGQMGLYDDKRRRYRCSLCRSREHTYRICPVMAMALALHDGKGGREP